MAALYPQIGQLVELIGLPMALRLVDNFGGVAIYVPHPNGVKEYSPLGRVIGSAALLKLAEVWPKERVMLPVGAAYLRRQRDTAIVADLASMSVREVALKYETTERHVYRVQARVEALVDGAEGQLAARQQGNLF